MSRKPLVRFSATVSLGNLKDPKAHNLKDPKAHDVLMDALKSDEVVMPQAAIAAGGEVGDLEGNDLYPLMLELLN